MHLCCYNKLSKTNYKKWKFVSYCPGGWEAQEQGTSTIVWWGLLSVSKMALVASPYMMEGGRDHPSLKPVL